MASISRRHFLFQAGGIATLPYLWQKPTLILHNGNFITMDPQQPRAQAVAIAGETIFAVGSNAEIKAMSGPLTKTVDMEGKTITPGFIDAHCHVASSGRRHLTDKD